MIQTKYELSATLVIASRNGATRLRKNLPSLPLQSMSRHHVDIVLVDSASQDATYAEMKRFGSASPVNVKVLRSEIPGLSIAQNLAIRNSTGYIVCFTDDDCRLDEQYFDKLLFEKEKDDFQFGSGEILIRDKGLDLRMANTNNWTHEGNRIIPSNSLVGPGVIQGANMFFDRPVLEAIGGIHTIGDGSSNDTMTGYLASRANFQGVQMRGLKVYHDHERLAGSKEADNVAQTYRKTIGAFYAHLIFRGEKQAMALWGLSNQNVDLQVVQVQLEAAAEELKKLTEQMKS